MAGLGAAHCWAALSATRATPSCGKRTGGKREGKPMPTPDTDAEEANDNGDTKPLFEFARKLERERDAWMAFADFMQTNGELLSANLYEAHRLRRIAKRLGRKCSVVKYD